MTVRTRFSPSPTGHIHLGNARTALFCALYAAKHHGVFVLRIEDTDVARSQNHYVETLEEDLHWLDIHWQEGPGVDGPYGPYWQSQRQSIYDQYYVILEKDKRIYPCFCSDQELLLSRKIQLSRGQAPRYAGTCRQLSAEEVKKRFDAGKKPAWRFIVPKDEKIRFEDVVKGPQEFDTNDIGDFIVRRADGTAPFLFCNAIDDAMMAITHVLRGEDHVSNTPRQIMLLETLNLTPPKYGHLPLILGTDGTVLSKRHGSFSVQELKKQGYLPLALINYLVRLGHTCDTQTLLDFNGLVPHFLLEKLSRSPAHFDQNQLLYWQKAAIQALDIPAFWHWVGDGIQSQVPEAMQTLFAQTIRANVTFPHDVLNWAKIFTHQLAPIDEEGLKIIREAGEQFFVEAEQAIEKYDIDFDRVLNDMKQTLGLSGKKLYMPLRIALTGKPHGPELMQIAALLGKDKLKHRLGHALKLVA